MLPTMLSTVRSHLSLQGKRFVAYCVVGTMVGGTSCGCMGYLIMDQLTKQVENEYLVKLHNCVPKLMHPYYDFVFNRLLNRVKTEGIEHAVFMGGWGGLLTGANFGLLHVSTCVLLQVSRFALTVVRKRI